MCCSVLSFLCIMLWTIACLSCFFFWPLCCLSVIYSRPLYATFVILNLSVGCHKFCWQGNKRHYQTLSYPCWEMDTIGSILYIDDNIKIIGFKCNLFPGFEAVGYIYIYIYAHVDTSICILFMTFKLSNIWKKFRIFECLWSYQY